MADSGIQSVYYALLYVTKPAFTPSQGPITNGMSVTISCIPSNAVIYYTLDGTTPTTNSTIYTDTLILSGNQTLQAFAVQTGYGTSPFQSVHYDLLSPESTVVTTVAGTGIPGWVDGPACAAKFNSSQGICLDALGNIYVADIGNHVIRKISTNGVVTTIAGNGSPGFQNGTGTNSQFNVPAGICVGTNGDIFVADRLNRRIRRITPAGLVTTFSGSGAAGNDDDPATPATYSYISHMAVSHHALRGGGRAQSPAPPPRPANRRPTCNPP